MLKACSRYEITLSDITRVNDY